MSTTIKKAESIKTKRFTVKENGNEVLNTSKREQANDVIKKLQEEFKPLIILIDSRDKTSFHYTKTIHQSNYRIKAGDYDMDTVITPFPDTIQTVQ